MKKIKIITMIVFIILIAMVSFFGVYTQVQNRMENQVREYSLDMDLDGARYIRLSVSTESTEVIKDADGNEVETDEDMTDEELEENGYTKETVYTNSEDVLTVENYEKTKEIIAERLEAQGAGEYEISVDNETGDILIQIPENDLTDSLVSNINTVGKFEIIDADTEEVLMDNSDIKLASVLYGSDSTSGTVVYLNIEFNKEGTEKLENISNTYIEVDEETTDEEESTDTEEETTDETTDTEESTDTEETTDEETTDTEETTDEETTDTEDTEETEEATTKEITLKIDDEEIMTSSFEDPIENGKLQLSIGSATTDSDTLQDNLSQASAIAVVLDSGNLPIEYELVTNEYILSDITSTQIEYLALAVGIIILIGLIVWIILYRVNGLLASISFIGLIATFLLVIRYTNVSISIQGIVGIVVIIILNYIFITKLLSNIKKSENNKKLVVIIEQMKESYKDFFIKLIPICISAIAFCFVSWTTISSFGMVMFWGIVLIALYNYIITATMLKVKAEK